MRTILGVAAGSTVTVTFITAIPSLWSTLILIPIMVILIGFMGVWYFQKLCGYDFPTAYYASMPGGLQDMLAFGEEAGGNIRAMSLIHATRVLVIVVLLPILLISIWQVELDRPPGRLLRYIEINQLDYTRYLCFCRLENRQFNWHVWCNNSWTINTHFSSKHDRDFK